MGEREDKWERKRRSETGRGVKEWEGRKGETNTMGKHETVHVIPCQIEMAEVEAKIPRAL